MPDDGAIDTKPRGFLGLVSRVMRDQNLLLLAIGAGIGTLTAFGAIGFAELLHMFEHYTNHVMADGTGWMLVVVPALGMGATGVLVHYFAGEAKGHGVPQVMKAVITNGGVIPLRVGVVKVFASILTVGSGGSAGTEGPIVQIGATAGSAVGQRFKVSRERMQTFVGCGAAAGIASIFNAPIAGVFFVVEILLRDFSLRTFAPVVTAAVFSTATTQAFVGENEAIFAASASLERYVFTAVELPNYVLLGIICGLVGVGFNKMLHAGEDLYDGLKIHPLVKPVTGAVLLGALGYAFLELTRSASVSGGPGANAEIPAFFGNGYETIRWLLEPLSFTPDADAAHPGGMPTMVWVLGLLVVLKAVATTLTLASGGSGGVFAPSLFLGAVVGSAVGVLLERAGLVPEGGSPASYALVGMAAVVAGTTHAPMTAILILYELTRDEFVILPIMLAAIVAVVTAQLVERDSIYTFKLRREGFNVGTKMDLTLLRSVTAGQCEVVPLPPEPVYASDPLSKLITLHAHHHVPDFVVVDASGACLGLVTGQDMRTALIDREAIPLLLVAELLRTDLPTVTRDETLDTVMDKFAQHDVAGLALVDPATRRPTGLITRSKVMQRYREVLAER